VVYVCRDVTDLSPLQGMPLKRLSVGGTRVQDLAPLKGMKLGWLNLWSTPVKDLAPLNGMPISYLNIDRTQVTDLSPLQGMELEEIHLTPRSLIRVLERLRTVKTLRTIGTSEQPYRAAEFWECYDKGEFGVVPFSDADVKRIAVLPAAEQVEEVRKELIRRNPGFDGMLTPTIKNDAVTGLIFSTLQVTDISPVRALTRLKSLQMSGRVVNGEIKGSLQDLSPLNGMSLTHLDMRDNQVWDLTPLQGMPLADLGLWNWAGSDLTPLKGMPLTSLNCGGRRQKIDLTPLAGLPLEYLCVNLTQVSDLAPLKDMPLKRLLCANTLVGDASLAHLKDCKSLTKLSLDHTQVGDAGLAQLKGMLLRTLSIDHTGITDLSPLQGMPLEEIRLTPKNITKGLKILRDTKSLKSISIAHQKSWPAAEFWERYDKGEFKE
jgi:Leucine-rich repeat (LRR) protein